MRAQLGIDILSAPVTLMWSRLLLRVFSCYARSEEKRGTRLQTLEGPGEYRGLSKGVTAFELRGEVNSTA